MELKELSSECSVFSAVNIIFYKKKDVGKDLPTLQKNILLKLLNNNELTITELSVSLNVTQRTIERSISKLKEMGYIKRMGGRKKGYWEII